MGTGKGRTNKLKNTRQMHRVFEKALLGKEHSPKCGFVAHPLNHRNLRENTEKHRDKKLSALCGNLSALCGNTNNHTTNTIQAVGQWHYSVYTTTSPCCRTHKVEWYPHTHDHSTLFSSITILQVMATAREQTVSRAGHYTIRPPAGRCRGNPP